MPRKIPLMTLAGTVLVLVFSIGPSLAAGPPVAPETTGTVAGEERGWELKDAKVVNAGATLRLPNGILINGYTVEADATPLGQPGSVKAKFLMTAAIFTPSQEMPGQKIGRYYVNGIWTIADASAAIPANVRHSPNMLSGRLLADLAFNPANRPGEVKAAIMLPGVSAPGTRSVTKATFSGNEKFEGRIHFQPGAAVKPTGATPKEAGK